MRLVSDASGLTSVMLFQDKVNKCVRFVRDASGLTSVMLFLSNSK